MWLPMLLYSIMNKIILLSTHSSIFFFQMKFPYSWSPEIVDTQILKLGNVLLVATPGEFTTMAGR